MFSYSAMDCKNKKNTVFGTGFISNNEIIKPKVIPYEAAIPKYYDIDPGTIEEKTFNIVCQGKNINK